MPDDTNRAKVLAELLSQQPTLGGAPQRPSLADLLGTQPIPDMTQLRAMGLQQLKQGMWNNLGVDYTPYASFNDSPTQQQNARTPTGMPTIDYLKGNEALMNTAQNRGEPGVNYPLSQNFQSWWLKPNDI